MSANRVAAAHQNAQRSQDRSTMLLAFILLLVALVVVLVNNHDFWFGDEQEAVADESTQWVPSKAVQPPAATPAPAPRAAKHVAAKSSAKSTVAGPAVAAISRSVLPPFQIEIVPDGSRGGVRNSSLKVTMPPDPGIVSDTAQTARAIQPSYPLLAKQMKVQGSVRLEALIGADGVIQNLRVLSGPAILSSAAREAAMRWRFRPYLQNGQPVESRANITVNLAINVLDNASRDQLKTAALTPTGE